jgi:hypothetical protein
MEQKKKPGRPKKVVEPSLVKTNGIVNSPNSKENMLELVYHNPLIFKKLSSAFKSFNILNVIMHFTKEGISIKTRDHKHVSVIHIFIDGSKATHYYCKEEFQIGLKRPNLDQIFKIIDTHYTRIAFISKTTTYRSSFYIQFFNGDMQNEEIFETEIYDLKEDDIPAHNNENYPLKFTLSSKFFKKKINDNVNSSQKIEIQKNGNDPIRFTHQLEEQLKFTSIMTNEHLLDIDSKISDDEFIIVSVRMDFIKPIAKCLLGNKVRLELHEKNPICIETKSDDEFCSIKVFTDIELIKEFE